MRIVIMTEPMMPEEEMFELRNIMFDTPPMVGDTLQIGTRGIFLVTKRDFSIYEDANQSLLFVTIDNKSRKSV